jgi:hypothetical protein
MKLPLDSILAAEAKALTALAFRNGPIENLHAGRACTVCAGKTEFSHASDEEIKEIMKAAVNTMYRLLWQRDYDHAAYLKSLPHGERYTQQWDDPEVEIRGPG